MNDNAKDEQVIKELVERARAAQKIAEGFSQRKVNELAAAIVYVLSRDKIAWEIAELAIEETGMGNVESKYGKLAKKMPYVLYDVKDQKTVGIVERDPVRNLVKIAKPVGVIGALIPSTNPEGTPVFDGILAIRGRNAVIFAPHPRSKRTTKKVVDIMRDILVRNGAPADLFICIENPTISLSQELMRQCDLNMATGSGDMVRAAYSAGKPAYGVGAGNAPIIVDETVNIAETAEKIRIGKTGDNASGCSAENSLIIQSAIYDKMIAALQKEGGYLANAAEKAQLQKTLWVDGHINRDIVAQPVKKIVAIAGIEIPADTRFIMVEETGTGKDYPFSGEKLSLVLTVYKYDDFDAAIDLVNKITRYSGFGHSCGIHSNNDEKILKLALSTYTTRVIVRQSHGVGNGGYWCNGLAPTFSLGCGTWGGNIVSENVTQKHFLNTTWVAYPLEREIPPDEEIFGDLLENVKL